MAVTRKEKETILTSLIDRIKQARGIVFAEYRGLTVAEANKLRKSLRKENVTYQVVKVTLLKKALTELKIQAGNLKFKGPVAIATSAEEETAPARIIKSFSKELPKLILDGGIFNNELVGADVVLRLASLPSRPKLLSQLLSVLQGPQRGLVTVLSGNTRNLLNVLNAIADKKK